MSFKSLPAFLSDLIADTITGGTITGSIIETAATGARGLIQSILVLSPVQFFSPVQFGLGSSNEATLGDLAFRWTGPLNSPTEVDMYLEAPTYSNGPASGIPFLKLAQQALGGAASSVAQLFADSISLSSPAVKIGANATAGGAIGGIDIVGSTAGTGVTNASGVNTYNHGLGVVPKLVIPIVRSTYLLPRWSGAGAATFTLTWTDPATENPAVGFNPSIGFIAIA